MKMKAGVLTVCGAQRPFAKSKPIHVVEVDLDPPGEGEVLVKVGGGGLCHSDLSLINGDRPRPVPLVLGHEGAGEIVEVGAGVHDVKVGDHVCFTFNVSCGRCRRCLEGRPYICERSVTPRAAGQLLSGHHRLHKDGKPVNHQSGVSCFAEYAVVDRGSIVVIDRSLPLDVAALFGCAVVTGVGAVVNTAQVRPGSSVAVVGLGGVGLSGLLGAVLAGAGRIVAIDLSDDKLGLARQLGATDTVNARDADHVKQVRDLTDGGVDYAFDLAGTIKAMETAYLVTRWGGTTVTAGPLADQRRFRLQAERPGQRGEDDQGQLHGKLRARPRHPALHRVVPAGQAAGRPHDEQAHRLRRAECRLRPAAGRGHGTPGAGAARLSRRPEPGAAGAGNRAQRGTSAKEPRKRSTSGYVSSPGRTRQNAW